MILWGIIANLPDLDMIINRWIYSHPLEQFFFHRGISHSLVIAVLIWIAVWFGLRYKNKWDIPLWRYIAGIFCSIVFWHLIVDGFTSYGVRYFLPRSDKFYSRDNMPTIDLSLLVTLVFLFAVFVVVKYKKYISLAIIAISMLRFSASFIIKDIINDNCNSNFTRYGLDYWTTKIKKFGSFPKFGRLLNWRCIYITEDKIYMSDHNIFKKNDIIWTQTASYNAWSQEDIMSKLYNMAWSTNVGKLELILSWNRGYFYISQLWDQRYLIQNIIFDNIGSQEGWSIDVSSSKRIFRNINNKNIWGIIKAVSKDIKNNILRTNLGT